jgi:hypothetical protein
MDANCLSWLFRLDKTIFAPKWLSLAFASTDIWPLFPGAWGYDPKHIFLLPFLNVVNYRESQTGQHVKS